MVPSRNGPRGAEVASFGLAIFLYVRHADADRQSGSRGASRRRPHRAAGAIPRSLRPSAPSTRRRSACRSRSARQIPEPPTRSPRKPRLERCHRLARSRSRGRSDEAVFPTINRAARATGSCRARRRNRSSRRTPSKRRPGRPSCRRAPKTADIESNDHTDSELPDAQTVVLADIARDAHRRNAPAASRTRSRPRCISSRSPNTTSRCRSRSIRRSRSKIRSISSELDPTEFTPNAPPSLEGLNADVKETRLYFGSELFGNSLGDMKPWAVGEAPVLMGPRAPPIRT